MATLCSAGPIALNTPAGLAPGDTFRFVFVSSDATTAESSDINDYNSFVNSEADGATYQEFPSARLGRDPVNTHDVSYRQYRVFTI